MKNIYLLIVAGLVCISISANAQTSKVIPLNYGLYGGVNVNMHSPDFDYILADPNLTELVLTELIFTENATSFGLNFGFIINVPIDDIFVFSGRLGYNPMGAILEQKTIVDGIQFNDEIYNDIEIVDELDASIGYLEVSPMMQFHNLIPVDNLYLLGGLEFGIPLVKSSTLTESINHDEVTFPNGEQSLTVVNNEDILDMNIRFALAIGAGYMFEIDEDLYLTPEVSFRIPFSNVSSHASFDSWSVPQLRAGVSLTFGSSDEKPPVDESMIDVGFHSVRHYDKAGKFEEVKKISVEEVQYTELFPLVPYVFTDEGSAFPSRQNQILSAEEESGEFTMLELEPEPVSINKSTLDIIGSRLRAKPTSKIIITGTNDQKSEKSNKELADRRAEFAKNYFIINYGINPNNIEVVAGGLPSKPSAGTVPEGIEENRRIEFFSNDPEIMSPILIEKEKQTVADPTIIEFQPYVTSTDTISNWTLEISQADKMLRRFNGSGEPDKLNWVIMPNELMASELPLDYYFSAENVKGKNDSESGTIPIEFYSYSRKQEEDRPDKSIAKYSLIVFDFDSPNISDIDKKILDENVLSSIKYNSTVQVYGYTDKIGDPEYNRKLALKRAENVSNYLKSKAKSAKYEVFGIGEEVLLFDNESPIGRQLSRTVQVYVITPKE